MSKQTIDDVPRHWAEIEAAVQGAFEDGKRDYKGCMRERLRELRALLDAPEPSAQPQGVPVEIGYIEHSKEFDWIESGVNNRLIWTMPMDQRHKIPQHYKVMLYAEQPAPVTKP